MEYEEDQKHRIIAYMLFHLLRLLLFIVVGVIALIIILL